MSGKNVKFAEPVPIREKENPQVEYDDEDEDESDEERSNFTRVKTMVVGKCKLKATESADRADTVTLRVCDALMNRTKEFYRELIEVTSEVPLKNRGRLKSFKMPEYTGPHDNEDPRFAKHKEYTLEEKKKILQELALANAEEVDVLPDVTLAELSKDGVISPSRGGIRIVRAFYRKCQECEETKPVGSFMEAFMCLECHKKKILRM